MNRYQSIFVTLLLAVVGLVFTTAPAHADPIPLPDSPWYAVVWNEATDTLHWLNSAGEQASQPRPKLPNEAGLGVSLYVSPNGQRLLIFGALNGGRYGIGFYDLAAGAFVQTHETMVNQTVVPTDRSPFSHDGQYAVLGLRHADGWQVIHFNVDSGDAIAQLTAAHPSVPANLTSADALPMVAHYDIDTGLGQRRVHLRFLPNGPIQPDGLIPGLIWLPEIDAVYGQEIPEGINAFDILPTTGQVVYVRHDAQSPQTTSGVYQNLIGHFDSAATLFSAPDALAASPRWVANGLMVAYRVNQQPFAPMWHLAPALGGQGIPFAPEFDHLFGTSDGFIIADIDAGVVRFSNTLQFEAFAPAVGNVIYQTVDTKQFQPFRIIYVTPMGTDFTLASLGGGSVDIVGGVEIAPVVPATATPALVIQAATVAPTTPPVVIAPPIVPTTVPPVVVAPPVIPTNVPPRDIASPTGDGDCSNAVRQLISVGVTARTQVVGGTLALRTNLLDEFPSHQVPTDLNVQVIGGPACHRGHRMWRIEVALNGQPVTGYVSEGFNGNRYLILP